MESVEEKGPTGESAAESEIDEKFGASRPKITSRLANLSAAATPRGKASALTDRKYVLCILIFCGLILTLISIIFLSVTVNGLKSSSPYPKLCTTSDCLWEAANLLENMNTSADPCLDLYSYACGKFSKVHELKDLYSWITVPWMISEENDEKLKDSLERLVKDFSDTSAEKKLKIFFQSCQDEFTRTSMGGKPLVDTIYSLGGWAALYGSFRPDSWTKTKFNQVLQSLHKLEVNTFFKITVRADLAPFGGKATKYAIYLDVADLGMGRTDFYLRNDTYYYYHKKAYRDYIQGFIRLLWKDAQLPQLSPEKATVLLNNVTDDIIYVETQIANLTANTRPVWNPSAVHKPISYLDKPYPDNILWYDLLNSYFSGAGLQPTTTVNLMEQDYIAGIVELVNRLSASQMNNYMMWKLTEKFSSTLGWEYIYLSRVWALVKYDGYVRFVGTYNWCLIEIQRNLQQLLSSLFVQDHFGGSSGEQVNAIFGYIQTLALQRIDGYSWMDASTKKEAKLKISAIRDLIGYPMWLTDNSQLNSFYSKLKIQRDAHFQNMQSVRQFQVHLAVSKIIQSTINAKEWPVAIYSAQIQYYAAYNKLYFPAGMLQHPIYSNRIPMFLNFATMGRYVAEQLLTALYYRCSDHTGAHGCWWSTDTAKKFSDAYVCNFQPYKNVTYCINDKWFPDGPCLNLNHPDSFSISNMIGVGSVNLAYSAYKSYVSDNGGEAVLPGLQSDSIDQAFFLGYGQTFCYNRLKYFVYLDYDRHSSLVTEILFNKVLSQMEQFGSTFHCPVGSPMTTTSDCAGF